MNLSKTIMDEFNYVKSAYQFYIGLLINISTFLIVSYQTPTKTILTVIILYFLSRSLGRWNFKSENSGFNRQNYMVGKHSPPWQTLFKVLWMLSKDNEEAKKELEEWI